MIGLYAGEQWFENVAKLCVLFRNSIQSVWVWGKIVASKGKYDEKQGQIILEVQELGCKRQIPSLLLDIHLVFFVMVSFFVQFNSHCNYFEWVNQSKSTFKGKEYEFESSGGKIVEEDKGCLEKDKVIINWIKKNERLKRTLQQEKKIGKFLQLLFVLSWVSTIVLVVIVLLKVNCNQLCPGQLLQ